MKSDIQIAQEAKMEPIVKIAEKLNLTEDDIELYGKYKCKISLDVLNKNKNKEDGKLVLVTAINPTPAGEGKSTVTVGLGQALCKTGKNAIIALLFAFVGIALYISLRYKFSYAVSALIALANDIIMMFCLFSIFNIEINTM